MKKNLLLVLVAMLVTLMLAACGSEETGGTSEEAPEPVEEETEVVDDVPTELTITHQLGETTVSINPEKVVVFDFGVLDSLDKLGVDVVGIPQANIPPYLSQYEDAKYENVGSLKEPDFEKIAEISPDLIVISGRQQELYGELTKLGPTVYMAIDNANYMESFTHNMELLGEIFNKEAEIESELAQIEATIANVQEKATSAGNALVVLANEGNISAYGPGSRFGILHDVFGLVAVDENIEVSTHGMNVSFEYIVEQNPDHLFVVDRGAVVEGGDAAAQDTIENELVQNTKAFQNGNITYLDPNYWYLAGGGLVSVSEMAKAIEGALE
ncbi:siderophore ABC transporter substrate-binding protein [Bacillus sp. FJAT-45350]|uniref:siderophore ABC transporter substrate-binding protein n=1 Tax=Bacillus sp. FJAT-45350 TaxID=2011014 RepID=UPI000BB8D55A|nr:siderophore ABC transporter substrate-binding protein [Bacillus sp. FJAT-45350]